MESIVNHKGYWCKVEQMGWKVRTWSSKATGQTETIVYPRKIYVPMVDIDDPSALVHEVDQSGTVLEQERLERAREIARSRERSRAKTKCRHRIKSHDLCQMLTGTYKENMTDFDRVHRDFKAWTRLMVKYIPNFRAVWAFEPQERGAWHWHAAIDKLPPYIRVNGHPVRSYVFVRQMWLRVVGEFEGMPNGTVNVDGHNRTKVGTPAKWTKKQSLAQIAAYVSKYLTKQHGEGLSGRNMWGSSQHLDGDKPVTVEIAENLPLYRVIDLCLANGITTGHRIVNHRLGRFGDFWLLYTEPIPL